MRMVNWLTSREYYVHTWHTPIVVKVFDADEYWYYAPIYNPKRLPALFVDSVSDLGQRWSSWVDHDASYGVRW